MADKIDEKILEELEKQNLSKSQLKELINKIQNPNVKLDPKVYEFSDWHIKIGVLGDTHLNSHYSRLDVLHWLYDWFKREGVEFIVHSGDITDGENMHLEQAYHLHVHGIDNTVEYVAENYPDIGKQTFFIKGNHDFSYFKRAGKDICTDIAVARKDLVYITGKDFEKDWWEGNILLGRKSNCRLKLFHPGNGTAYALSYQIQKLAEFLKPEEKPKVCIVGHYHKMHYIFDRNIHFIQSGTTKHQDPWMRSKQLSAMIGGYILDLYIKDDGTIDQFKYVPKTLKDMGLRDYGNSDHVWVYDKKKDAANKDIDNKKDKISQPAKNAG